jgi:hypothetical protein
MRAFSPQPCEQGSVPDARGPQLISRDDLKPGRIADRAVFLLERLLLRGMHYRLLVIAALIGFISIIGGAIVFAAGEITSFGDALWWAFLRLTDPGYLSEDIRPLRRTVSTILTVLGYVVFLGSLVAIMTQWLNQMIRRLESGLTPIAERNHVLILGWTSRTPALVRELLQAQARVQRFLRPRGTRSLRIVILAEEVTTELNNELRERLGSLWSQQHVVLRSGTPLRLDHLQRVDHRSASAIVLPAADPGPGTAEADSRTIKTLLTITTHADAGAELPLAVAEIIDERKVEVADRAYPERLEILASDSIISRLIAQNVRHPGLSHVYAELLTYGRGNEMYIRDAPTLTGAGVRTQDLIDVFPNAVLLGVVRRDGAHWQPILNPPDGFVLEKDDRLALLARNFEHCEPALGIRPSELPRTNPPQNGTRTGRRRILVLGWSHKVPPLLREFDGYENESFEIDLLSTAPAESRTALLQHHDVRLTRARIRHIEGDYTAAADLRRADPAAYDSIVMMGSDRLDSTEEADARTIVGYLLVRELIGPRNRPHVVVELLDSGNAALFRKRRGEIIVTPQVLSHMLAQVVLRRELRALFDELFGPGGAEIAFRRAAHYVQPGEETTFRDLQVAAARIGETALGIRFIGADGGPGTDLHLNPLRNQRFLLGEQDDVIVLTTEAEEE